MQNCLTVQRDTKYKDNMLHPAAQYNKSIGLCRTIHPLNNGLHNMTQQYKTQQKTGRMNQLGTRAEHSCTNDEVV